MLQFSLTLKSFRTFFIVFPNHIQDEQTTTLLRISEVFERKIVLPLPEQLPNICKPELAHAKAASSSAFADSGKLQVSPN